jgi:hypothetical protein
MLMAGAAAAGMGALALRYYQTDDYAERRLLRDIMRQGIEIDGDRREDQAKRIISALDAAFKRNKPTTAKHG